MNDEMLLNAAKVIPAMLIVGKLIKNAIPKIPNRNIPLITWIGGIIALYLLTGENTWKAVAESFLIVTSATGIHSGFKNHMGEKVEPKRKLSGVPLMALLCLFSIGCATSTIDQRDTVSADGTRTTETRTKIRAFFASESKVSEVLLTTDTEGQQTSIGSAETKSEERATDVLKEIGILVDTAKP